MDQNSGHAQESSPAQPSAACELFSTFGHAHLVVDHDFERKFVSDPTNPCCGSMKFASTTGGKPPINSDRHAMSVPCARVMFPRSFIRL